VTSSKSARRARREARRRPEPRTEPIPRLRTAAYDATTIEFTGASDIGTMPAAAEYIEMGPGEQPLALPPAAPGYAATTGPMRALGRPAVSIGDALARDDHWGRKLIPLPCGHCGTPPRVPDGILERTRIIGHVNWLALRDGWKFDTDLIWTCPQCQQGDAWKARQGQMEVHRYDEICLRHDANDPDADCTCPGAVLAVDVMLASEDHLGSGRGRHVAVTR
jgi:hypothetical protein